MKAVSVLIPVAVSILLGACSREARPASAPRADTPPARVRLASVQSESIAELTEVTGTIRPVQRAQLAAKVMGAVEEMPVTLGQRVHTGDLLVKINAAEISARVAQAESQLNSARRDLGRERDLLAKGASTADIVRGLEDRFAAAQAMVREAQAMLGYATLRAPFDGVVARKLANAGDLASPGLPLLELEGTRDFQVEAAVPDSLAARLQPGSALTVAVPAAGTSFTGSLAELSPGADANAHTVLAKISVPAGQTVRSGEFARVQVPGPAITALMIPASAVSQIGQMERVFVATPTGERTRAVLRLVKTGAMRAHQVEVLAGLDAGERIILAPPAGLVEGQPLEAMP